MDHVPVPRAVQCMQEVTVGKGTLRKMHEIDNLKMTQYSLVGGYERLRGIFWHCFQGRDFFPEDGGITLFLVLRDYVSSCICTMSGQGKFQIQLSLSWHQLTNHYS
jgi:hypothetical protein